MKDNFLLEIGTEEIPASYVLPALSQIKEELKKLMNNEYLHYENIETTATPRRLAVFISELDLYQDDREELFFGPPVSAAYQDGKPTTAAHGFARSKGAQIEDCITIERNNGKYLAIKKTIPGKNTADILQNNLSAIIGRVGFPKSMRWTASSVRFARPVRWLVALLGEKIIDFSFGNVKASNLTQGHRFLKKEDFLLVKAANWQLFHEILQRNGVILSHTLRKKIIIELILTAQKKHYPNFSAEHIPEELLNEVTFLCEYPSIGEGNFSEKYLDLPDSVLTTTMTHHQKYFPVYNSDSNLLPLFLFIFNNLSEYETVIRKGNEKVLRARLEDALFFYQEDLKIPMTERTESLKGILFQTGLGSYFDKVTRLESLAEVVSTLDSCDKESLKQAAALCKNDLTTHMVYEYPELQGVIGNIYSRKTGLQEEITTAIEEHYSPRHQKDLIPDTKTGKLLSILDKFDTLTGLLGIGKFPSGSKDPFGLRRAALGIGRIMIEGALDFDLSELYVNAYTLYDSLKEQRDTLKGIIFTFIKQRILNYLSQEKEYRDDLVDACFPDLCGNYYHNYLKLQALTDISREPQFDDLTTSFKRIGNIILQAQEKFPRWSPKKPEEKLLKEPSEKELFDKFCHLEQEFQALSLCRDYSLLLKKFSELRSDIDKFFDEVLVMDPDEALRYNRFNLLAFLNRSFLLVADFTKIRGEQSSR